MCSPVRNRPLAKYFARPGANSVLPDTGAIRSIEATSVHKAFLYSKFGKDNVILRDESGDSLVIVNLRLVPIDVYLPSCFTIKGSTAQGI